MFGSIFLAFALLAPVVSGAPSGKGFCARWCGNFCASAKACNATDFTTPICIDDNTCQCLCPSQRTDCSADVCEKFCRHSAGVRKYTSHCDNDNKTCKCVYMGEPTGIVPAPQAPAHTATAATNAAETHPTASATAAPLVAEVPAATATHVPVAVAHNIQQHGTAHEEATAHGNKVEHTFVADESLLKNEFVCTSTWCNSFCQEKAGNGHQFTAHCDATQSCHCEFPLTAAAGAALPRLLTALNQSDAAVSARSAAAAAAAATADAPAVGNAAPVTTWSRAKCVQATCDTFCAKEFQNFTTSTGVVDAKLTSRCGDDNICQCSFNGVRHGGPAAVRPLTAAAATHSGNALASTGSDAQIIKYACTASFCNNFCSNLSNGKKFEATCAADQHCKCVFPWHKTSSHSMTTAETSPKL